MSHIESHDGDTNHRRTYFLVFAALTVLTLLELGAASIAHRGLVVLTLVLLAVAKAALVALFYMHLRYERPIARVVVIPLMLPALFAAILIAEAHWRH